MLPALVSLLPGVPTRAMLPQLGLETATGEPLLAMLRSRAAKVLRGLLAGSGDGHEVAAALLGGGHLARLLELATVTVPNYQTSSRVSGAHRSQLAFAEHLALYLDATLAQAAPFPADAREAFASCESLQSALRLGVRLSSKMGRDEKLLELCGLGLPAGRCAEALDAADEAGEELRRRSGRSGRRWQCCRRDG